PFRSAAYHSPSVLLSFPTRRSSDIQVILTSKVGNNFNEEKQDWFWDPSREHIEDGVKDSLHRLGTDYIDFYMLHGGTIDDPIGEDRKSTRLNSSHVSLSYAAFCLQQ